MPGLGLKRGLADDLVIAPYATALASLVDPAAAAENFERLAARGPRRAGSASTKSLDYSPRSRDVDAAPRRAGAARRSSAPSSRTTRACRSSRSPTSSATTCSSTRFHADPRVQATELLLQERVPREAILSEPRPAESATGAAVAAGVRVAAVPIAAHDQPAHALPVERPLHHGAHPRRRRLQHVARPGGHAAARRPDVGCRRALHLPARSVVGPTSGRRPISPSASEPDQFEATFDLDKVTFRRRDGDFETQLQVTVSPEDDVEVRRLSITNRGDRPREIEVTSYAEIVLARPEDDLAHPAFGKLFIETEFDAQSAGLLFSRRPRARRRSAGRGRSTCSASTAALGGAVEWETDRARFLGRGRSPANPLALDGRALSGTTGAVLDPVAALRERVRLAPGAFVRVTFATGVAPDRATALALARKYRDGSAAARAFSMAFTHVHITLQHLGLSDDHAILFDRLASRVFGSDASCISPDDLARNTLGQPNLWGYGISGDLPIVLVRVTEADVAAARAAAAARAGVLARQGPARRRRDPERAPGRLPRRDAGLAHGAGAGAALGRLERQARRHVPAARRRHARGRSPPAVGRGARRPARRPRRSGAAARSPGAVAVRRATTCRASATLARPAPASTPVPVPPLVMENGLGGFTPDGREYVVVLDGDRETPLPWSNVLANPEFGTMVSASGSAFTWAGNSRENRLTPFANDPVSDPTGEAIYLRDEDVRRGLGRHAGTAAARGRMAAAGSIRHARRRHALPARGRRARAGAGGLRRAGRSGEAGGADADQHVDGDAAPQRVRLRRVVPRAAARRRAAVRRHRDGRGDRRDPRAQRLQHGVRRPRRVLARHASRRGRTPCDRAEFVGRNRTLAAPAALFRERLGGPHRRRPRSVRGAAGRRRDRAGRIAPRRVRARPGARRARTPPSSRRATRSLAQARGGARPRRALLGRHARRRAGAARRTIRSI